MYAIELRRGKRVYHYTCAATSVEDALVWCFQIDRLRSCRVVSVTQLGPKGRR